MKPDEMSLQELSPEEQQIMNLVRSTQYGEVLVFVQKGIPIRAEIKKSVVLKNTK